MFAWSFERKRKRLRSGVLNWHKKQNHVKVIIYTMGGFGTWPNPCIYTMCGSHTWSNPCILVSVGNSISNKGFPEGDLDHVCPEICQCDLHCCNGSTLTFTG